VQKQSDKPLLHGLDLRARLVKFCEVVAELPAVCWLRFDVASEFRVIELVGAPAAGRAFASEVDRGVDRHSIELGVCISVVFQSDLGPYLISRSGEKNYYALEIFLAGHQFVGAMLARVMAKRCLLIPVTDGTRMWDMIVSCGAPPMAGNSLVSVTVDRRGTDDNAA